MKWTKEKVEDVFGDFPHRGIDKYDCEWSTQPGMSYVDMFPDCDDYEKAKLLLLRYWHNGVSRGALMGEWDLFTTDILSGCVFIAFENDRGETEVLHANNENFDDPSNSDRSIKKDRFEIFVDDRAGIMTLYKNPKGGKYCLITIPLNSLVLCCYPEPTTIMPESSNIDDRFVGYHINDILNDGYCAILATHEPKGEIFYLFIKEPGSEYINMKEVPHLKGGGCILI